MPSFPSVSAPCCSRHRTLLVAVLIAAAAQGQEPASDPAAIPPSTLLVRLKSRLLTLDDARALTTDITARPTRVRLQVSEALRTRYERAAKDYDAGLAAMVQRVERLAESTQKQTLGPKGAARVEQLRSEALAVTRRSDLSKQAIHDEIDPRMAELRQLLLPQLDAVLAADPAVAEALAQMRSHHEALRQWYALYVDATRDMEGNEEADKHFAKRPPPPGPGAPEAVDDALRACSFAGLPMSATDKKALAANEDLRLRIDPEEWLGTLELNRLRYALGLPLLRIDEKLCDAARDHSEDMRKHGFFSHTSPVEGKRTPGQRAANFGTSAGAENIAAGQSTGAGAIEAWWYSPGHHQNMLGNHHRVGLGRSEQLWTQMFGG